MLSLCIYLVIQISYNYTENDYHKESNLPTIQNNHALLATKPSLSGIRDVQCDFKETMSKVLWSLRNLHNHAVAYSDSQKFKLHY